MLLHLVIRSAREICGTRYGFLQQQRNRLVMVQAQRSALHNGDCVVGRKVAIIRPKIRTGFRMCLKGVILETIWIVATETRHQKDR